MIINFGGGLKGTGVPLVRINASAVQPQMNQPRMSKMIDKTIVHPEESKRKKAYNLSTQIEAKTKSATKPRNNTATGSVIIILSFLLPVAARYTKLAYLSQILISPKPRKVRIIPLAKRLASNSLATALYVALPVIYAPETYLHWI